MPGAELITSYAAESTSVGEAQVRRILLPIARHQRFGLANAMSPATTPSANRCDNAHIAAAGASRTMLPADGFLLRLLLDLSIATPACLPGHRETSERAGLAGYVD